MLCLRLIRTMSASSLERYMYIAYIDIELHVHVHVCTTCKFIPECIVRTCIYFHVHVYLHVYKYFFQGLLELLLDSFGSLFESKSGRSVSK